LTGISKELTGLIIVKTSFARGVQLIEKKTTRVENVRRISRSHRKSTGKSCSAGLLWVSKSVSDTQTASCGVVDFPEDKEQQAVLETAKLP
jgi:hypothetical protein